MKKILVAAAVMGLAMAGAARAEDCGTPPTAPTLPDAATAKADEVNKASKEVEAFANGIDKWQTCMNKWTTSEVEKSNAIIENYTKLVAAFKERNSGDGKK